MADYGATLPDKTTKERRDPVISLSECTKCSDEGLTVFCDRLRVFVSLLDDVSLVYHFSFGMKRLMKPHIRADLGSIRENLVTDTEAAKEVG